MMHFLLIYDVVPDFVARHASFRDEHLALAWRSAEAGELLLGGAVADPADQAFLLFQGASAEAATRFAQNDPYVRHDLVSNWRVRPWNTVVGKAAATPVRPQSNP
jgi:uncharacterized protein YciI